MPTQVKPASPLRSIFRTDKTRSALVIGALGVVFGDLGTSPIYTIQTIFDPNDPHPVAITTANLYGVVSVIFWSVMVIVVVPITAVIIIVLFAFQSRGTAAIGRLFGPVMVLWFGAIGACGVGGISKHPEILRALSPTYALTFFSEHFGVAL